MTIFELMAVQAKKLAEAAATGIKLKGSVQTIADLPALAAIGDAYTVIQDNNTEHVKTASGWVKLGPDGTVVSGTHDGTNWQTITIGDVTKAIPSGGGGGGSVYAHSIKIWDGTNVCTFTLYNSSSTAFTMTSLLNTIGTNSDPRLEVMGSGNKDGYWYILTGISRNQEKTFIQYRLQTQIGNNTTLHINAVDVQYFGDIITEL